MSILTVNRILAEFYTAENAKKSGSVHATYLVSGLQEAPALGLPETNGTTSSQQPDEVMGDADSDMPMPSSPFPSSSAPGPSQTAAAPELRRVLTLVREEQLDQIRATYKEVTSMHIYSLETASPKVRDYCDTRK